MAARGTVKESDAVSINIGEIKTDYAALQKYADQVKWPSATHGQQILS